MRTIVSSFLLASSLVAQFTTYGSGSGGYYCNGRGVPPPDLVGGNIPRIGSTYTIRILNPFNQRGCGNGPSYFINIIGVNPVDMPFQYNGDSLRLLVDPYFFQGETGHVQIFYLNNGAWELDYQVPNNPHIVGFKIYHQVALHFSDGLVAPHLLALSNGLKVSLMP